MQKSAKKSSLKGIQKEFPILSRTIKSKKLIYFDNAATAQKPDCVIKAINKYYTHSNANVNRGIHTLGEEATKLFDKSRIEVAKFLNAPSERNIIFLKNATEGFNYIAKGFAEMRLSAHDDIVVSALEHHSNYLPWYILSQKTGCHMHTIPIDSKGYIDVDTALTTITEKTKFIALTHMSNVLGTIQPIKKIIAKAKEVGAFVIIDGAQAAAHIPIDVTELDADVFIFSGHKVFGPTGTGAMYVKEEILSKMTPLNPGGGTILDIQGQNIVWNDAPTRFEGGTPNIAGVVGLATALKWLKNFDIDVIEKHEQKLTENALDILKSHKVVTIHGDDKASYKRGPVISFSVEGVHPHDIATVFNEEGIAIRAGHHCAIPLMKQINVPATARLSFSLYNTPHEVEKINSAIEKVKKIFL